MNAMRRVRSHTHGTLPTVYMEVRANSFGAQESAILQKPGWSSCLGKSWSNAQNPCKHHVSHHVAAWLLHVTELCRDVASTESGEHVAVLLRFHESAVKKLSEKAQQELRPNEPALRARRAIHR